MDVDGKPPRISSAFGPRNRELLEEHDYYLMHLGMRLARVVVTAEDAGKMGRHLCGGDGTAYHQQLSRMMVPPPRV